MTSLKYSFCAVVNLDQIRLGQIGLVKFGCQLFELAKTSLVFSETEFLEVISKYSFKIFTQLVKKGIFF